MADPDSTFRALQLPVPLCQSLQRAGKTAPFAIQAAAIPELLAGRDCLLRAATGSGKTLAFGLPMLAQLAALPPAVPGRPRGIIIVPTRDLGLQIHQHLEEHAASVGLRILCLVGGGKIARQRSMLAAPASLLIVTPGRLLDLRRRGWVHYQDVDIVACDEVDELAQLGFAKEVSQILYGTRAAQQHIFTSATLDSTVRRWVRKYMTDPQLIAVDAQGTATVTPATNEALTALASPTALPTASPEAGKTAPQPGKTAAAAPTGPRQRHWRCTITETQLPGIIKLLLASRRKIVLFANSKAEIRALQRKFPFSFVLHGDRSQAARTQVLHDFRRCQQGVLLASDVAARGIDISALDLVVQLHPPFDAKTYIHRSGRTARAQAEGDVLLLELADERAQSTRILRAAGICATEVAVADLQASIPALRSDFR